MVDIEGTDEFGEGDSIDFVDDAGVVGWDDLAAVFVVGFEAVIVGGVVACGDDDACSGF